jgi:maltooligosyltrehalose trehalohydrolase
MGEEYGETAPFHYFISHSDEALVEAVKRGRRGEFASFGWEDDVPDPRAEGTFMNSKLTTGLCTQGWHKTLLSFYRELLRLRKEIPALSHLDKEAMEVKCFEGERALLVRRWFKGDEVLCLFNFNEEVLHMTLPFEKGTWIRILESSAEEWGGSGVVAPEKGESRNAEMPMSLAPNSFVLYGSSKGK